MSITRVACWPYRLPLRRVWQNSQGRLRHRSGWILELHTGDATGYGDCAPLSDAGTETPEVARSWLTRQLARVRRLDPAAALESLPSPGRCPPAARCAVETALLDLCAQRTSRPLARWLNPDATGVIRVNANIGVLDRHAAVRAQRAVNEGFAVVKIKVGVGAVEEELQALLRLARALPAGVALRLDANRAWQFPEAQHFIRALRDCPIEALEEPLASPDLAAWATLQRLAPCRLAVDESLSSFELGAWAAQAGVRRIVIKPMVVGGLRPALALANSAGRLGMDSLVTTTVDSAVGVWAAVHLAAALPAGRDQAHGLATSRWLARDLAAPPPVTRGAIRIGCEAGLGVAGRM